MADELQASAEELRARRTEWTQQKARVDAVVDAAGPCAGDRDWRQYDGAQHTPAELRLRRRSVPGGPGVLLGHAALTGHGPEAPDAAVEFFGTPAGLLVVKTG